MVITQREVFKQKFLVKPAFKFKKPKGVIVWDFDGVLFDTKRLVRDHERIFNENRVNPAELRHAAALLKKNGAPFSLARLMRILRHNKVLFSEKSIRRALHRNLLKYQYVSTETEKTLHYLRRFGFANFILSFGSAPFQYKKIKSGCGKKFLEHFTKVLVTKKPKSIFLKRILRKYSALPIFFIDDKEEHIALVRKHIPQILAVHFKKGWSVKKIARLIFAKTRVYV